MSYRPATLAVADGGLGQATLTQHGLLVGAGTSAITQLAEAATGTVIIGNTGADPSSSATPTVTSIKFGSGTTMSTYNEGTFNGTIAGASTAGVTTYTQQSCSYVKIGKLVWVSGTITWTAATGTGIIRVGGLPFIIGSAPSAGNANDGFMNHNLSIATATSTLCYFQFNNTFFTIFGKVEATGATVNTSLAANQNNSLNFSCTYISQTA